jgi:hypothetical protein
VPVRQLELGAQVLVPQGAAALLDEAPVLPVLELQRLESGRGGELRGQHVEVACEHCLILFEVLPKNFP